MTAGSDETKFKEFGTVHALAAPATLQSLKALLKTLIDDYEHHHKNEFPFYNEDPTLVWDVRPGILIVGWHIAVPVEHLVEKP